MSHAPRSLSASPPLLGHMPETPLPLLIAVMAVVCVPVIVLSQVASYLHVDVVDDQMFAYYGWRILHGATVYVDVWDNKPPGIYWLNALGLLLGGGNYLGVIALCGVALAAALGAFYTISATIYFRGAAALGTCLASFYITHGFYQGGANRTETFLITFELLAVSLYFRGHVKDRWWLWLLAGVLCGCAFLCKQVGLAAWGAMGLHTTGLVLTGCLAWQVGLQRCLLLLSGVLLTTVLAAAALAARSALDEALFATFVFNRAYFEAGSSTLKPSFANRYMLQNHMMPILRLPILMSIAALLHAVLWWWRPHFRPAEIEGPLAVRMRRVPGAIYLFAVWWAAAFYGAILSPHHFEHYLVPTVPPLLLAATYLINVLRTEISLTQRMAQRAWVVAAFVLMGYLAVSSYNRHMEVLAGIWNYRYGGNVPLPAEWEFVGAHVAELTRPEDSIQCFGYMPGVYLHARRLNASRYTTTERIGQLQQTGEAEKIRRELIERLGGAPPAAMVMNAGDYLAVMNPELASQPPDSLSRFLKPLIERDYVIGAEIAGYDNLVLLLRRDRAAGLAPRVLRPG